VHYYQFHIGDYRSSTAHLTNEEDLAYRRLIDMYYDFEGPIPLDTQWVARRIRVEPAIIQDVLKDMFERTENGYVNARCEEEIAKYKSLAERNKRNGSLGGRPKKNPDGFQSEPTGKLTINQEPITNNQIKKAPKVAPPDGVSSSVWEDFLQLREAKKAPMTTAALSGIMSEAEKAGWGLERALSECCLRGWQGFKAEWVAGKADVARTTVPSTPERDPALVKIEKDATLKIAPPPEIRDKIRAIIKRV
jgi:uncharacterized protein YdaU (DUF1376 family)